MNPGPWGILIIAVVVLLLFGRGRISSLMGEVAGGIKAFRKGMADDEKPVAEIDQSSKSDAAMSEAKDTERNKDA
ncbi:twin-arginine translocase TatA/TatE family subunit [Pelagibacterium xiamenense]|uniref:twin-arginine translocase TatA/TatE family subunit n=1 Tax=Pelagibacterium xiamenense TaxID=2901140 RepID=UPI001E5C12B0|nr:twin-arginine translocase TatA/TatE family subunit [Pelagibacterium xiamenense]MCD7061056.1 twin-arginine translocase TatA/TatE family subunit [Pelagibacterium xiamenense]